MGKRMWIMAAVFALGGCSASRDKTAAEAAVARFHEMLDQGRYHDIYAGGAAEFRRSASEPAAIAELQRMHDRLGDFRTSQESGWRVNYGTGGHIVQLNYTSQFASAAGTEDFIFRLEGNGAQLVGYHVNSPALNAPAPPPAPVKPGSAAPPAEVAPAEPAPDPPAPDPDGGK